jgi:hypothetical protein
MDFVVIVMVPAMEDYASFARRWWFESNKSVARFDTHVVLDRVKPDLAFQIPAE